MDRGRPSRDSRQIPPQPWLLNFLCGFGHRRHSLVEVNQDADNAAWLREFAENRSEAAFARLVRQHLNLVYSAALRRCGGRSGLAQDVCQKVFIDLARKAPALPADLVVAGWLYQHACFVASTLLRAETRRQQREEAAMQNQALADDTDWSRLAPLLDDALLELAPPDRDSLILRYFQQRPFAEVGDALGLGENAARMRVDRALDKLRAKLAKRGVTSTAAALATALVGPAVPAAPASLAASITAAALAATVTTTSTVGLLSLMVSTKLKVAMLGAVILAVGVPLAWQQRTVGSLRDENARLRQQLARVQTEVQSAQADSRQTADERARLREVQAELLRLRGELALRRQPGPDTNAPVATTQPTSVNPFDAATWSTQAAVGFHEALVTSAWAWKDQAAVLLVRPVASSVPGPAAVQFESTIVVAPLPLLQRHGLAASESDATRVLSQEATTHLLDALKRDGARLNTTDPTTPGEEGFVYVGFTETDHDHSMTFTLAPEPVADRFVNLAVSAERRMLDPLEQQILQEPDENVRQELIKRRGAE